MGDVQGSGTEGTVFIELIGVKGKTERIALREANDSRIRFEKGKSYKFTIETSDVGKVSHEIVTSMIANMNIKVVHDQYRQYYPGDGCSTSDYLNPTA